MTFTEKIFSVTQINSLSRKLLEDYFFSVLVEGEISNYTLHSSGHMYFTIKDEQSAIDVVMYKGYVQNLAFKPERGISVVIQGKISIFVKGGRYQLIAFQMQEKGVGDLEKRFLMLKKKLSKEGLFDEEYKKPIPEVPQTIGIVTSPTGAAIRDIIHVVKRRFANVRLILHPARVQGDNAAPEIVNAIKNLNTHYPDMDVMIVGRGGGSLEDLWPFNEEIVARAIFQSEIPVISAVGHEIDFTISDFVSDLRAPTPSAAAEIVIKNREEIITDIRRLSMLLNRALEHKMSSLKERINFISESAVFKYPARMIEQKAQETDYISAHLEKNLKHLIDLKKHVVKNYSAKLHALSPLAILKRGYSITSLTDTGEIIKDVSELASGREINTRLHKGSITSKVLKIKKA
jgi:exodeoxyribonuclease VII large subunit